MQISLGVCSPFVVDVVGFVTVVWLDLNFGADLQTCFPL